MHMHAHAHTHTHTHTLTHTTVDMVDAWMKMKDNVFGVSGAPMWSSLDKALRSIKQMSVADKIKSDIGTHAYICNTDISTGFCISFAFAMGKLDDFQKNKPRTPSQAGTP